MPHHPLDPLSTRNVVEVDAGLAARSKHSRPNMGKGGAVRNAAFELAHLGLPLEVPHLQGACTIAANQHGVVVEA